MRKAILHSIIIGYRHFDAAAVYQSEQCLGEALAQALELGLVKSRQELFITSKLWCAYAHPDRVLPALQNTLKRLGMEYIVLYLIHYPMSLKSVGCGLPRNIGVSNFSCKKLEHLLLTSMIPPAVNQVEMSPFWQQAKLGEFCQKKGIHITAFSDLGATGTLWASNQVLDSEVLKEIAETKGKTVAQFTEFVSTRSQLVLCILSEMPKIKGKRVVRTPDPDLLLPVFIVADPRKRTQFHYG
ncbi:Non-functional NADPH-dependent codeinone reductase [Actinidia chinensis var. chinensis]|uniref:Non-functional NADPH-dependent codeinone reductase n=1 Tax=Actinidia chinensis var. chinensis TaxID=1590841 RepID=A0A2R6PGB7_ACTCC|nr:Non-functional NADPH-dependent codeinone reductase [Actinidia chinensis var. chinensis]